MSKALLLALLCIVPAQSQSQCNLRQGLDPWLNSEVESGRTIHESGTCLRHNDMLYHFHCPWESVATVSRYGCAALKFDCTNAEDLIKYYSTGPVEQHDPRRLAYTVKCIQHWCPAPGMIAGVDPGPGCGAHCPEAAMAAWKLTWPLAARRLVVESASSQSAFQKDVVEAAKSRRLAGICEVENPSCCEAPFLTGNAAVCDSKWYASQMTCNTCNSGQRKECIWSWLKPKNPSDVAISTCPNGAGLPSQPFDLKPSDCATGGGCVSYSLFGTGDCQQHNLFEDQSLSIKGRKISTLPNDKSVVRNFCEASCSQTSDCVGFSITIETQAAMTSSCKVFCETCAGLKSAGLYGLFTAVQGTGTTINHADYDDKSTCFKKDCCLGQVMKWGEGCATFFGTTTPCPTTTPGPTATPGLSTSVPTTLIDTTTEYQSTTTRDPLVDVGITVGIIAAASAAIGLSFIKKETSTTTPEAASTIRPIWTTTPPIIGTTTPPIFGTTTEGSPCGTVVPQIATTVIPQIATTAASPCGTVAPKIGIAAKYDVAVGAQLPIQGGNWALFACVLMLPMMLGMVVLVRKAWRARTAERARSIECARFESTFANIEQPMVDEDGENIEDGENMDLVSPLE